jgi:PAS domain S-box-containing protein
MLFHGLSIQRKLMRVILLTSLAVLTLTCSSFFIYEIITFRQTSIREMTTLGHIIAGNCTAPLAFNDEETANEILSVLKAEPHISAACLYYKNGEIFTCYPPEADRRVFPSNLQQDGYDFNDVHLSGFQSISEGDRKLGTLYLQADTNIIYERFRLYGIITPTIIMVSLILSFFLSKSLQRKISFPIIALAETAKTISDRGDYSIRAKKADDDEIGSLTESFNHMLGRIENQTRELLESNARTQAVINSALSAVIIMGRDGTIQDWNERAERIFGWTHDEILGKDLADTIIPSRYREAHKNGLATFFSTTGHGPVLNKVIELSAIRKSGTEFPVELLISTLTTSGVVSFCGFVTDITQRKKAEEEAKSFNQRLEQLVEKRTAELLSVNNELESFSYSISHDLRAPLRSIHGYMNILAEEYGGQLDEEGNRLINIALRSGQRMGQLIDDLLAFSRLGRSELIKSDVNMEEMVSFILDDQRKYSNQKFDIQIQTLPMARADHNTIKQVWVNLVSNAIKYSQKKEKIIIEIGSFEKGDTHVYYVRDNGAGFNMKYYDKLFGVFHRLHSHAEFEGTGVGLAIVHRIVARHGGKVWAEGKVDEGATFYFSLKK